MFLALVGSSTRQKHDEPTINFTHGAKTLWGVNTGDMQNRHTGQHVALRTVERRDDIKYSRTSHHPFNKKGVYSLLDHIDNFPETVSNVCIIPNFTKNISSLM